MPHTNEFVAALDPWARDAVRRATETLLADPQTTVSDLTEAAKAGLPAINSVHPMTEDELVANVEDAARRAGFVEEGTAATATATPATTPDRQTELEALSKATLQEEARRVGVSDEGTKAAIATRIVEAEQGTVS